MQIVKSQFRLLYNGRSKPFWVDESEFAVVEREVNSLITNYIDNTLRMLPTQIDFSNNIPITKQNYVTDMWGSKLLVSHLYTRQKGRHLRREMPRMMKKEYQNLDIKLIPSLKLLQRSAKQGIHTKSMAFIRDIMLYSIWGTYFQNSINYAKHQNVNIQLYLDPIGRPIDAKEFIKQLYTHRRDLYQCIETINKGVGSFIEGTMDYAELDEISFAFVSVTIDSPNSSSRFCSELKIPADEFPNIPFVPKIVNLVRATKMSFPGDNISVKVHLSVY